MKANYDLITSNKKELKNRKTFIIECIYVCDYLTLYAHEHKNEFPENGISLPSTISDEAIKDIFLKIFGKQVSIHHDPVLSKKICVFMD